MVVATLLLVMLYYMLELFNLKVGIIGQVGGWNLGDSLSNLYSPIFYASFLFIYIGIDINNSVALTFG